MEQKQTIENTKHTNIRIPAETYKKIEELAARNQRTVSGQIRYMIDEYLRIKEG